MEYHKTQALANMDRINDAFLSLEKSVREGKRFYFHQFDYDPDLVNLFNTAEYERIVKYWH